MICHEIMAKFFTLKKWQKELNCTLEYDFGSDEKVSRIRYIVYFHLVSQSLKFSSSILFHGTLKFT